VTVRTSDATEQADYYDHHVPDPEFEINRPHGESRFYRYLMDFKFTRVVQLLSRPLQGRKVLVVCCGSGMDAEYLVRTGASVVAMDISHGCLKRARLRASRYGLKYELVRGDADALPFCDGAFDYGFVHDGLHHLSRPDRALAELARVASRGVMVSEPAHAKVTDFLIRLNLAKHYEEAGNYVMRLELERLESLCRSLGFDRIASSRYLVKYGHPPGHWWRLLDSEPLFGMTRAMFNLLGVAAFGRWGNKLAFVAERSAPRPAG
jgi:ubiquinone/menaquinone biosynthesis C-methylase UbiE